MHASHQIFCTLKYTMVFSKKNWEIDIFHRKNMGPLRVHGRTIKSKYKPLRVFPGYGMGEKKPFN